MELSYARRRDENEGDDNEARRDDARPEEREEIRGERGETQKLVTAS